MRQSRCKQERNQAIECMRMVLSMVVVFHHIPFPGKLGSCMDTLVWFAVPCFLMVSGYFSFGADGRQICSRMKRILAMIAVSDLVYILWFCVEAALQGFGMEEMLRLLLPDRKQIAFWALFQIDLFQRYLWYLWAVALCYLVLLVYMALRRGKSGYRGLYAAGLGLFAIYGVLALLMPLAGYYSQEHYYRNGWLTGIPMFAAGLFLREYGQQICCRLRLDSGKLLGLAVVCILLSLYQNGVLNRSTTPLAMPVGVAAMVLLSGRNPALFPERCRGVRRLIRRFGTWSAGIFLFHMTAGEILRWLLGLPMGQSLPADWRYPPLVLAIALGMTLVYNGICRLWRND